MQIVSICMNCQNLFQNVGYIWSNMKKEFFILQDLS